MRIRKVFKNGKELIYEIEINRIAVDVSVDVKEIVIEPSSRVIYIEEDQNEKKV